MSDLENFVLRTIERWYAARYVERHGLVTSYDSKKHLAKVMYQPEQFESGWLPIETNHMGAGFGMLVGLTPGDGKKTGDQVIIRPQEGDFESMKIVKVVHSDKDNPPEVKSGEMMMWTKWGQKVYFKNDGSLTLQTGQTPQGADQQQQQQQQVPQTTIHMDNQGNITTSVDQNHTVNAKQNISETAGSTHQSNAPTINEVGNVHLGSTGGSLVSMFGTIDSAGHADLPPVASKVFAT